MASCPQFLSVRRWMDCSDLPLGAGPRWLTERVASTGKFREAPIRQTRTQARVSARTVAQELWQKRFRKKPAGQRFFYLHPALMAERFPAASSSNMRDTPGRRPALRPP
jgi:hypothetical protein